MWLTQADTINMVWFVAIMNVLCSYLTFTRFVRMFEWWIRNGILKTNAAGHSISIQILLLNKMVMSQVSFRKFALWCYYLDILCPNARQYFRPLMEIVSFMRRVSHSYGSISYNCAILRWFDLISFQKHFIENCTIHY